MNKEILAKMKGFYEEALTNKLAEAIGVDKKNIKVAWSIDETKVKIDMTTADVVSSFNFTFKDENLTVEMENYKVLFNEADSYKYINGVQAKSSSIDLQTLLALQNIFKMTLEQDYVEESSNESEYTVEQEHESVNA